MGVGQSIAIWPFWNRFGFDSGQLYINIFGFDPEVSGTVPEPNTNADDAHYCLESNADKLF